MAERKDREGGPALSPERQALVDEIVKNLEEGAGLWVKGWASPAPASLVTGKAYRGANNLYLSYVAGKRGYDDNRWVTFSQMERNGWTFKKDADGNTLGGGASVPVEFYEFRDRATRAPYDRASTDGMSPEERDAYLRRNVYPVKKTYRVFNASLVDGVPEPGPAGGRAGERNERIERLIKYWGSHESRIVYGGDVAGYSIKYDEIQLPPRRFFLSRREFYSTALHEMGHSTGHPSRLDRHLREASKSSYGYAMEELRAELGSVFMEQDFAPDPGVMHVRNNAAYIGSWIKALKDDPEAFYRAVADAEKISRYVSDRSAAAEKEYRDETAGKDEREERAVPAKTRDATPDDLRLSDRELLEKCSRGRTGGVFAELYDGSSGFPPDKAAEFLCLRLAAQTEDADRIMRILKSSAVYDEDRGEEAYAGLVDGSLKKIAELPGRAPAKAEDAEKAKDGKTGAAGGRPAR